MFTYNFAQGCCTRNADSELRSTPVLLSIFNISSILSSILNIEYSIVLAWVFKIKVGSVRPGL